MEKTSKKLLIKRSAKKNNRLNSIEVCDFLKKKLFKMEFKPGQLLSEKQIVSEFKLSRTTVRHALAKMESDGLVEIIPRKGAFIKLLSVRDIVEIFQIRKVLEGLAARLAAENIDLEELKKFEESYLRMSNENNHDTEEIFGLGLKFHDFIIDNANNQRIKNIIKDLRVHFEISRIFFLHPTAQDKPSRGIQSIEEHLSLIEALKERNGDLAEERMKRHIANAESNIFSFREPLGIS